MYDCEMIFLDLFGRKTGSTSEGGRICTMRLQSFEMLLGRGSTGAGSNGGVTPERPSAHIH